MAPGMGGMTGMPGMAGGQGADLKKQLKTLTRTDFLLQFVWKPPIAETRPKTDEDRIKAVKDFREQLVKAEEKNPAVRTIKEDTEKQLEASSLKKSEQLESQMTKALGATPGAPGAAGMAPAVPGAAMPGAAAMPGGADARRPGRRGAQVTVGSADVCAATRPWGSSSVDGSSVPAAPLIRKARVRFKSGQTVGCTQRYVIAPDPSGSLMKVPATMAKEDTTEQIKEVLRQIIKYRFWISIGFAALFAVIAYFMGSGPVQAEANKQITTIKTAVKDVEAYKSPTKPTDHYKPIVEEKTGIMAKDVNKAWKELYDRQAPLLTWPDTVKGSFSKWGRTWPETEDPGKVRVAIVDYVYAYPAYVDMVYHTFNPFDYETGKGIVAAPSKEELLRPAPFTVESMPAMGKVWAAQERLWIQRTLLEVVREVNKKATNWDSAYLKQIIGLEVGNPLAQDQRFTRQGPDARPGPGYPRTGRNCALGRRWRRGRHGAGAAAPGGMAAMMPASGGMSRRMGGMGAMGAMGGGGGGGAGTQYDDTIYYVTPAVNKGQYKILPVSMTVLIDQEHVQDLLVELENSPMSIQVMDFELERPSTRVTKPEKGETPASMGMGMGMGMGRMGMMGGMMGQQAIRRHGGSDAEPSHVDGQHGRHAPGDGGHDWRGWQDGWYGDGDERQGRAQEGGHQ